MEGLDSWFPTLATKTSQGWGTECLSHFGLGCAASVFDVLPEGVGQLGAVFVEDAARGALYFFHQAMEVIARADDG